MIWQHRKCRPQWTTKTTSLGWHRTLLKCPKPRMNGSTKKMPLIPPKTASKCTTMDAPMAQNGCGTCVALTASQLDFIQSLSIASRLHQSGEQRLGDFRH